MLRLSRPVRHPRIVAAAALLLFIVWEAVAIYLYVLDRRLRRELVSHTWREPTVIVSNAGGRPREITRLYGVDWRLTPPVGLDEIPRYVSDAFCAAEDVRFRHHLGIDPIGMMRALVTNVRAGGIAQGGSSIDQQIIKTRFLSQERTWRRKFTELILAVVLDARLSKDEILEIYLNEVYLGHNAGKPVLGIDEASRLYFGKRPALLRVDEAALLAGIVRAPNRDTPEHHPEAARARRDAILGVMQKHGWISDAQYRQAVARGVAFVQDGSIPQAPYPYYLRAIRSQLVNELGIHAVLEGALTIVCEMDPRAQAAAERVARRAASGLESRFSWIREQSRNEPLQVAILSVDPRSGGIRALVGGSNYDVSPFDRTTNMRRQPGSAFKTFAYLPAIASKKATTASLLLDAPVKIEVSSGEDWEPHNYDGQYRGRVTLREAFEKSLNVPTVRLTEDIGVKRVANTAQQFGFEEEFAAIPALPLGVTEVTMRELTAAYTAFPNLGKRVEPFLLREVSRKGEKLFTFEPKAKAVAPADATYVMHTLLRGVVQRGTASRLKRYGLGYVAGKTGTTNDYRDAWFVGYTPDMVTSVWVGFDHGAPLRLSSAEAAIPVWGSYMSVIPHDHGEPPPPKGVTFRDIDPETGMLWSEGCPGPVHEVFLSGTAPTHHCPRGIFGNVVRRIFFDRDNFDEPPAITYEQFRKWAAEADRDRQQVESALDKLRRIFRR